MFARILDCFLNLFSRGHNLEELSRRLNVPVEELTSVQPEYREFDIEKRSGQPRRITAPSEDLKRLQRRILRRLLKKLKTHPQATGFQQGVSFVENARCHEGQEVVIRFDLVNFFPSIDSKRIYQYFRKIGWKRVPAKLLTKLTTYQGALPQGAPTSPRLSNLVNYLFDVRLSRIAEYECAIYTRYADDLTFSLDADVDVQDLIGKVLAAIRKAGYHPHLTKKFSVRRQHNRQIVTGLVVNESANLSREKRRWLRAVEHRTKLQSQGGYFGPKPTITEEQLQGWRSLQKMIEDSKAKT